MAGAFFSGALVEFILEKTHLHLRKKQGCTSKGSQETCYSSDLQDLTQAEACECVDSVGQYVDFMGKDGHDTDGSLSLGKGKASGYVDVPVGVTELLSSVMACRSPQSVALVTPRSCVEKTIFVKGVEGNTMVHRVKGFTAWELIDGSADVWVTYNGKKGANEGYHGGYWDWES